MIALCSAISSRVPGSAFPGRHKSSLSKHEAPVRRQPDWGFSQITAHKRGRATVCHRPEPSSANGKSRSENVSSSTMYICAETAACLPQQVRFRYGIDSAGRPGHGNHLTLPSGSGREPSVDGSSLNDRSLLVHMRSGSPSRRSLASAERRPIILPLRRAFVRITG